MSMKLKRSTVDDVKNRFEYLKKKKNEEKKEYSLSERLQDAAEEEIKMAAYNTQVYNLIKFFQNFFLKCLVFRSEKKEKTENVKKMIRPDNRN